MSNVIDGRASAARWQTEIAGEVADLRERSGITPGLRVIIVGNDPASRSYVRRKSRVAGEVGIDGQLVELDENVTTDELLTVISGFNEDAAVHGILVQLPLPPHVDEVRVLRTIAPEKDVDGFHPVNVGGLFSARDPMDGTRLLPCTPLGCMRLIDETLGVDSLSGKEAVVIGRSNIVGKPMAALLLGANCSVSQIHSRTVDPAARCRDADIVIAAVGRPGLVDGDWIKPGAAVIDVGINRVQTPDGGKRLVGDVDFDAVAGVAGAITPVPGGVGPMTVAGLMFNTLTAARATLQSPESS
ncbi:MAG: tetrahydrofolate dehydrogenase/cyclohydrolase catalytic domain-containing protein [Ectothiorhodospiraceae bacterium]|jgi:methylenetetrahydrofolate dehydrogenase (NADP+)/methenyltetrahydrofolate cyclohydrolase